MRQIRLTRAELLAAAQRARTYPAGMAYAWGYGPLTRTPEPQALAERLSQCPELTTYG